MIVDSSAVIAILRAQPDARRFAEALVSAPAPLMSAGTYLETAIVVDALREPAHSRRLDDLLAAAGVEIVGFTPEQARLAREAYRDFGKGSGHPAGLNLGDCFAYALARESGEPLLFKGEDFGHTDVRPALT